MTSSTPNTINSLMDRLKSGTSPCSGLLLALLCALFLPGCSKSTSSELDAELTALESSDAKVRETALLHLASMPDGAAGASKAVGLLKDTEKGVRLAAIGLIAKFEQKTPEAVAGLVAAAGDADEDIQSNALSALTAVGAHEEVVKICKGNLASADVRLREQAAMGLAESGEHASAAQTELEAALGDEAKYVRMYSATALGNIGGKAVSAKAKLEDLTKDKDPDVAAAAKEALGKIQ